MKKYRLAALAFAAVLGVANSAGAVTQVQVHNNSSQQASLSSTAYAQGNDVHFGPATGPESSHTVDQGNWYNGIVEFFSDLFG